ncbi:hypothetical protein QFZ20_002057 [Flavobacterium sp. W4I14]|nr:hypothetical protein [Flavobacterium sp. W4I14]
MNNKNLLGLLAIGLLTACGSAKPLLSNYHQNTYDYHLTTDRIPVDVIVSTRPIIKGKEAAKTTKTFADWPDSIKHIYLKAMVSRTKTPDELVKALQIPIEPEEKKQPIPKQTKYNEYKLVFEFANVKNYYLYQDYAHPATRLEFLTTHVKLAKNPYASFYTIDKLQNEFEEMNLGGLERTQDVSFNSKFGINGGLGSGSSQKQLNDNSRKSTKNGTNNDSTFDAAGNQTGSTGSTSTVEKNSGGTTETNTSAEAKVSASAEASYANEQAVKEARELKFSRMKLGYATSPDSIIISQRAMINGDISQNVFVTATIKFRNPDSGTKVVSSEEVVNFDNLYGENNQFTPADKLKFGIRTVQYVNAMAENLHFTSAFKGEIRAVKNLQGKGGNNILEYDDEVTYSTFKSKIDNPITLDRNEFVKSAYRIKAKINGEEYYLNIAAPKRMLLEIFGDDDPNLLIQWLKDGIESKKATNLESKKFKLFFSGPNGTLNVVAPDMKGSIAKLQKVTDLQLVEILPPAQRQPATTN